MNLRAERRPTTLASAGSHRRWESGRQTVLLDAAREGEFFVLPFPQQPVLPRTVRALPDETELAGGAAYEPKFDGYRALVFVQAGVCRIHSRHGRDITGSFPEIAAAAVEHVPSGVVLDGELVVWGEDTSDFTDLRDRLARHDRTDRPPRPASFIAVDVLAGAGMDMRRSPLRVRRQALEILLGDAPAPLHVVPQTRRVEEARAWMDNYADAHVGVDGVVAKGLTSRYEPDDPTWKLLRIRDSVECVVGAVTGGLHVPTRLILGVPDAAGQLHLVGCTTEMTLPQSRRMGALLHESVGHHPWTSSLALPDVPGWTGPETGSTLVMPMAVVEVATGAASGPTAWLEARELIRARPELMPSEIDALPPVTPGTTPPPAEPAP